MLIVVSETVSSDPNGPPDHRSWHVEEAPIATVGDQMEILRILTA